MPAGQKISVLIVDDIAETRENIKKLLQFESDIEVVGTAKTGREALTLVKEKRPHVVLMDINMPDMDGITATELIVKDVPSTQIVILSVQNEPDYLRRAMMAGARDFVTKPPSGDELIRTIRRMYEISKTRSVGMPSQATPGVAGSGPGGELGKIISIYSAKGGVGCTTILTNLAAALNSEATKTVLVDCNLQFGDVGVFLNLQAKHSVIELFERAEELDPEFVASVIVPHSSGVKALLAPTSPEQADVVNAAEVKKALEYLRREYAYVLVDTPSGLNDIVLSILDASDRIILVVTPDIPAIKDARIFFDLVDALEFQPERVMLVLNRADKRGGITAANIQDSIKHDVVAQIPLDDRAILHSINNGVPLMISNRGLPTAQAMADLANKVVMSFSPAAEKELPAGPKPSALKPAARRQFGG
ncbi:MAG: response regulator [Chloroflexota bacterium]